MDLSENKAVSQLMDVVAGLKTKEECLAFFSDICTIKELLDLGQRLEVALALDEGLNYQEISQKTGVSSATISRVNRCLMYGDGGYKMAIDRIKTGKSEGTV